MADLTSNVPILATPALPTIAEPSAEASRRGTSKLALLTSFAAGAAFSWILILVTTENNLPQPPVVSPPGSTIIRR